MSGAPDLDGPQWAFAIELYERSGVGSACLLLQDQLGVDVNVLLVALYAAVSRGLAIGRDEIAALDGVAAPWRTQVVAPLRALRQDLRAHVTTAPREAAERIRARVKSIELQAEQVQHAMLARALDGFGSRADGQPNVAAVLAAALLFYANGREAAPLGPDVAEAVRTIANAAR